MAAAFHLTRAIGTKTATRLRGNATAVLDVIKTDNGLSAAGSFVLAIGGEQFPIIAGTNTVAFAFDIPPDYGSTADEFSISFAAKATGSDNVASAWAEISVTQCDLLMDSSGTVATDPLTMTPLAVTGQNNSGSGGGHIAKAGTLASATTIEIVGYYPSDVGDLAASSATNFYAPRWINEDDYVAVEPAAAIPVFGAEPPAGSEGDWGWIGGDAFDTTIPADQWSICKVKIDGGAPVFALLSNMAGF